MVKLKMSLPDLISAAETECKRLKYGLTTLEDYKDAWNAFGRYAQSIGEQYYQEQIAAQFLKNLYDYPEQRPKSRMACAMIRALRMLGDYNLFGRFLVQKVDRVHPTTEDFQIAVSNYWKLCLERNNLESTMQRRMWSLYHILDHFIKQSAMTCRDITPEHISSYVESLTGYSKKGVEQEIQTLRGFLNSMYLSGQREDDLSLYVPKLYYPKSEKLPTVWSAEELSRIFSVIDRSNPVGKRDYCMILLAVRCGLRTSDIKELLLENIKWERSCIEFIQQKTGVEIQIPLPEDVGMAIIDYLKYARPKTEAPQLLVKMATPFDKLRAPFEIFTGYLVKAGIKLEDRRPHGMHTLRHTLATRLLENDVPLEVISGILGHTSLESVKPYLKINLAKLRECALREMMEAEHE